MRPSQRLRMFFAALLLSWPAHLHAQADTIQTTVPHLKEVFARDFTIGCLLSYRHVGFASDPYVPGQSGVIAPNGGYLIKYHMNGMSPGNNMKPQYTVDIAASAAAYSAAGTQAAKDSIDIHPVIAFSGDLIAQLNWAQRQGFTFRGHTLVWHSQTPAPFFRTGYTTGGARLTKPRMILRMESYIREVIRLIHAGWPGLLTAMDVVNESVNDNGTFRTASNEWYTTFGDTTYVMKAFELTRQYALYYGETQMKLYYNDYNTSNAAKATGIVNLCAPIFQAGLLDGIGMQEHDNLYSPTAQAFVDSYNKFAPVCSEMAVTELDVATGGGSNSPGAALLKTQANQYAMLFKCFVERSWGSGRGKIVNISKDGLNDQYTFQTNQSSSLWDSVNHCKPAYYAVVDVGRYYNGLDSLCAVADTLHESAYTPGSWGTFAASWAAARSAMTRNYSPTLSASDTLHSAYDALIASFAGLELNPNGVPDSRTPIHFALDQNYPNPFNPATQIRYSIPERGEVSLRIFSILGEELAVLADGVREAGTHSVTFNAAGLPSGIYFCRLRAGTLSAGIRLMLLR